MRLKDFQFPKDIILVLTVFYKYIYYSKQIKKEPSDKIIKQIKTLKSNKQTLPKYGSVKHLEKVYGLASFYAIKVFHNDRACLIKSLTILSEAGKIGQEVQLVMGVKKNNGDLDGHSWICINGKALIENDEGLQQYTVMKEY